MLKPKRPHIFLKPFLILALSIFIFSCAKATRRICIKDGRKYCVTSDKIHVLTWDACYRRGVNCMEGECWEHAIEEFKIAIDLRYEDARNVRAYGMHFREEYFPHRELGITYFRMGRLQEALYELDLSMAQTPSARAKYYLNEVRKSNLLATRLDRSSPVIYLELAEGDYITNQTPFEVNGSVQDDQYVASIHVNQEPVFIELAEPSIAFSLPVDLKEGWNSIDVVARDLVDRESKSSIRLYLDQQGPLVLINPVQQKIHGQTEKLFVNAVVYDASGVESFKLGQKEVKRLGLDQLCLIEESIDIPSGVETIPFWTQDYTGNITQGNILIRPNQRAGNVNKRLASNEPQRLGPLALMTTENGISFDITHPTQEDFSTFYDEIFLEGKIKTENGIQSVKLNERPIYDAAELDAVVEQNMQNLIDRLVEQDKDPETYINLLQEVVSNYDTYHLNQRLRLEEEITNVNLMVEDQMGNKASKTFYIQKVPREDVLKSEQRMILAPLPFDAFTESPLDLQRYINSKVIEYFVNYGRFDLVEREKLPWVLIEKTIEAGGKVYKEDIAQKIGEMSSAEGVLCGYIQNRKDGTEILARFVDVDKGIIRMVQDVFTPSDDMKSLDTITSGLAMKFRDSFPVSTGNIIARKGNSIIVDIGSEKGIFPGMVFNIYKDEEALITKAFISDVEEGTCEARISEGEKVRDVDEGLKVRTR